MLIGFDWFNWPDGSVLTNLVASVIFVLPVWLLTLRKMTCRVPWCLRFGRHPVSGTTYKVCHVHHKVAHHEQLYKAHKDKHPDRLGYGESHDL